MTEMNHYLEQERKIAELQKRVTSLESLCFQSKPVINLEEASFYLVSLAVCSQETHAARLTSTSLGQAHLLRERAS